MNRDSDHVPLPRRGKTARRKKPGVLSQGGDHRSPKSRIGSRASAQRPGFKKRPKRNSKP